MTNAFLRLVPALAGLAVTVLLSQSANAREWPLKVLEKYRAAKTVGDFVKCEANESQKTCEFYRSTTHSFHDERMPKLVIVNSSTIRLEKNGAAVTIALPDRINEIRVNSTRIRITGESTPGSLLKDIRAAIARPAKARAASIFVQQAWAAGGPWDYLMGSVIEKLTDEQMKVFTCAKLQDFVKTCLDFDWSKLKAGMGSKADRKKFAEKMNDFQIKAGTVRMNADYLIEKLESGTGRMKTIRNSNASGKPNTEPFRLLCGESEGARHSESEEIKSDKTLKAEEKAAYLKMTESHSLGSYNWEKDLKDCKENFTKAETISDTTTSDTEAGKLIEGLVGYKKSRPSAGANPNTPAAGTGAKK